MRIVTRRRAAASVSEPQRSMSHASVANRRRGRPPTAIDFLGLFQTPIPIPPESPTNRSDVLCQGYGGSRGIRIYRCAKPVVGCDAEQARVLRYRNHPHPSPSPQRGERVRRVRGSNPNHPTLRAPRPSRQKRLCCPASPRAGMRTIFCGSETAVPISCAARP
jgi:hypothetical protein